MVITDEPMRVGDFCRIGDQMGTIEDIGLRSTGIRTMLYSHPKVERDGARIRFVGFGGSPLDLEIFAYVKATEMADFLAIQEDLPLRIMDIAAMATRRASS